MKEIEESDIGNLSEEIKGLRNDKLKNNIIIKSYHKSVADSLKNGNMGKDIYDIINNKKIVKVSFIKQIKYKINKIIDKIFKTL